MSNTQQIDAQNARIQAILAKYLELRAAGSVRDDQSMHLDEDTLSAFAEGGVAQREAVPIMKHLSDCSFCRHKTVELVRLELDLEGEQPIPGVQESREPVSVSSVLSGILSRIFGSNEAAVFAHQEPEKEDSQTSEDEPEKE